VILDLSTGDHPAIAEVFADYPASFLHLVYGFVAGLVTPPIGMGMTALFTGYQVTQAQTGEPWERTGGEFLELGAGILLAAMVKVLNRKRGARS
jgi:hypothetical protein